MRPSIIQDRVTRCTCVRIRSFVTRYSKTLNFVGCDERMRRHTPCLVQKSGDIEDNPLIRPVGHLLPDFGGEGTCRNSVVYIVEQHSDKSATSNATRFAGAGDWPPATYFCCAQLRMSEQVTTSNRNRCPPNWNMLLVTQWMTCTRISTPLRLLRSFIHHALGSFVKI